MLFTDRLTLDGSKKTRDGYLVGRAKVARTGLYDYSGQEVDPENKHGLRDKASVKVFRPGDEVFDKASLQSFIGKPIANDHPRDSINADNWRQHARGTIMGAVRDGEYVGFDYLVTDAAAVRDIDAGKKELSNGYSCDLDFTAGIHDGVAYDAVQRNIRGNHLAIVKRGRAGAECRITDAALCEGAPQIFIDWLNDQRTYNLDDGSDNNADQRRETDFPSGGGDVTRDGAEKMKFMLVDGLQVEVTDQAEAAINKLLGQVKDEREGRAADKSTHDKAMATKDGEIDTLKKQVIDQAGIDKLADAKASVVADAKAIVGDKLGDTKGKSVSDVRRMACTAAGIDVADKSDDYVEARFDTLKDAKPDTLRDAITNHPRPVTNDSGASVRDLARSAQY